jgi:hypothetical protein
MRSSVVVISSVNASFNTVSRNIRVDGRESELSRSSTATRPVEVREPTDVISRSRLTAFSQGLLRVVKPQGREDFARPSHLRIIERESHAEQTSFPRSVSPGISTSVDTFVSAQGGSYLGSPTDSATDAADIAPPQDGIFIRCLTFLKRVGAGSIQPPYTIDTGLNRLIAGKRGFINLVGLLFLTRVTTRRRVRPECHRNETSSCLNPQHVCEPPIDSSFRPSHLYMSVRLLDVLYLSRVVELPKEEEECSRETKPSLHSLISRWLQGAMTSGSFGP